MAYPTDDHVIPWRLFCILYDQIPAKKARRQLELSLAMIPALSGGKAAQELLEDLRARAYPAQ